MDNQEENTIYIPEYNPNKYVKAVKITKVIAIILFIIMILSFIAILGKAFIDENFF